MLCCWARLTPPPPPPRLRHDLLPLVQEVESYQAEIQEARKREAALRKEEQELRAYKAEAVGRMSNLLNEVSRMYAAA